MNGAVLLTALGQQARARRWAESSGRTVTGAFDPPAREQAIEAACSTHSALIVDRLPRLGSSPRQIADMAERLRAGAVRLVSLNDYFIAGPDALAAMVAMAAVSTSSERRKALQPAA